MKIKIYFLSKGKKIEVSLKTGGDNMIFLYEDKKMNIRMGTDWKIQPQDRNQGKKVRLVI
jgi:hypothetical protein